MGDDASKKASDAATKRDNLSELEKEVEILTQRSKDDSDDQNRTKIPV